MAYNFFDLGIKGPEIKRRLELLSDIHSNNGVVGQNELKEVIDDIEILDNNKVNIIQNNVYGQSIKIDDILKEKTPMSARISSKNLIPFPYYGLNASSDSTTFLQDGLTFKIWNVTNNSSEIKG